MAAITKNQKVSELFNSVTEEVSLHTLESFKEFMSEKVELDGDMHSIFEDFKKTIVDAFKTSTKSNGKGKKGAKTTDEPKKKRALSPYNLYIQNKMKELKEAGNAGNLMKMAIEAYKADKASGAI